VSANRSDTAIVLLEAAQRCLQRHGVAGLSTRKVAEEAGMPLSQIHYHLGSKRGLLLALLEYQNKKLLARQEAMFARPQPLWERWLQACDYLDDDLASGYVRVLQEMIAAGWSDPEIANEARRNLRGWYELLTEVATQAAERLGGLGPLEPAEAAALAGHIFLGAEAMILLGFTEQQLPSRSALRKVGELLRALEPDAPGAARARRRTKR
jgi:AcrR family transcriptional regulator